MEFWTSCRKRFYGSKPVSNKKRDEIFWKIVEQKIYYWKNTEIKIVG